jgi:lysophospholipase L1-like esterase
VKRLLSIVAFVSCCAQQPSQGVIIDNDDDVLIKTSEVVLVPRLVLEIVETPPPVKPTFPRNVLIIGDSEACAVSSVSAEVAAEYARDNVQPLDKVRTVCKSGSRVDYWAFGRFLSALNDDQETDNVIVFLGGNHIDQTKAPNISVMLDIVSKKNVGCFWAGNALLHGKTWKMNDLMREAVTPTCDYVDLEKIVVTLSDGLHPDRTGAKLWLQTIWFLLPLKHEK